MDGDSLVLVVGTYSDAGTAADDFDTLRADQEAGEYKVVGAVVMSRDHSGKVDVHECGDEHVAGGATVGAIGGLVIGLFVATLLTATAIDAGIGALSKRQERKKAGVNVEDYLPPGSSAIVTVVHDIWAGEVENALVFTDRRISKAIDSGDYDEVQRMIWQSSTQVPEAITK